MSVKSVEAIKLGCISASRRDCVAGIFRILTFLVAFEEMMMMTIMSMVE